MKDLSFLDIIEEYIKSDKVILPPFDKTALRLQQEVQKGNVQVSKIEKLIVADPSMSSQLLKLANSSFFRGLEKVATIRDAIVRLGLDEVSRMVLILSQKKMYATKDTFIKTYRKNLWQHSLVCALASQWVAKEAGFDDEVQEVFFAALIHDIGKLFLITVIEKIKASKEVSLMPSTAVINEIINSQHAVQGSRLLEHWNIPEAYCQVAREHHFKKFDSSNVPLVILRLVNKLAEKLGVSMEKSKTQQPVTAEATFLGFSDIKLAQLELKIEDSLSEIQTHYNI